MTAQRAQEIIYGYERVKEIRDGLKLAANETTPDRKFAVFMGNLGHMIPKDMKAAVYAQWWVHLMNEASRIEEELKAI